MGVLLPRRSFCYSGNKGGICGGTPTPRGHRPHPTHGKKGGEKGVNDLSLNAGVVDPPPCLQCARFKEKLDRIRVLFSAFRYGGPVDGKKIKAWDIAAEIETLTEWEEKRGTDNESGY